MFDLTGFVDALVPSTFEQLLWWGIGGGLARSFGKQLDYDLQNGPWFENQPEYIKNITKRVLDFLHHWWAGGLIMQYGPSLWPNHGEAVYWFGAGMFVDDLPDLWKRVKDMKKNIEGYLNGGTNGGTG